MNPLGCTGCFTAECPLSFCHCGCHREGSNMMHCMPCCSFVMCRKCGEAKPNVTMDLGDFKSTPKIEAEKERELYAELHKRFGPCPSKTVD